MKRTTAQRPEQPRALVTGSSGGIGGAIARSLSASGCEVLVHASGHPDRAAELAAELTGPARPVVFDLADAAACRAGMEDVLAEGPLHVVVHNAGIHADAPMAGMSAADWERVVEVNLNGFFRVVQPAILPMCRARWGRIIAVSSVAGRLGNRGQANYAASKAGLHGAVFSLARELGSRGITANVIAPGIIETPMSRETFDAEAIRELVPAGRAGRADEVASLAGYLCGPDSGYINGQVIGVDGGMTAG